MIPVQAASYYVSGAGADSNAGTQSSPWATISKVNAQVLVPGDRVYFRGGDTFAGSIYLEPNDAGTATNPVIITSYGTGRATIANTTGEAFYAYNTAGVEIRKLNFTGGSANTGSGISFYFDLNNGTKKEHVVIDQVNVSGFGENGITFGAWPYPVNGTNGGFKGVTITNVKSYGNKKGGFFSFGQDDQPGKNHTDFSIAESEFYNNPGVSGNTGSGVVISGVDGALVEYCRAYSNGTGNTGSGAGPVGMWCYAATNVVFQYNISHDNHTGPNNVDGGGFDIDGGSTNCVLQYNYSYNNAGPGYLLAQYSGAAAFNYNTVRYNISRNDARKGATKGGIHFWSSGSGGGIQNTDVYGNTIYLTQSTTGGDPVGIRFESGGTSIKNSRILNNLFVTENGKRLVVAPATVPENTRFAGNGYYSSGAAFGISWGGSSYTSLSSWRSATGQEKINNADTGFQNNPLLVNAPGAPNLTDPHQLQTLTGFKLGAGSPAINAGIDFADFSINPCTSDFFGNTIPNDGTFDSGAHEVSGNSVYNNCGGSAVAGTSWTADAGYSGGTGSSQNSNTIDTSAANAGPAAIYQRNRYGNTTYTYGGYGAATSNTIRLHFCETYWNASDSRKFNVKINGTQVLTNFDIYANAGKFKALVQQFSSTANSSGQYVIEFITVTNNALVSGIEISELEATEDWTSQDIGSTGVTGSATVAGNLFTVRGAGADIWNNADAFHLVHRPLNGDGVFTARVDSVQNTDSWAKAGVMIRESLAADSKHAMMAVTPDGKVSFQRRTTVAGSSASTTATGLSAPRWVRVVRSGNNFTAYHSGNGTSWTQLGTAVSIPMPAQVYMGLAVTSKSTTRLCEAVFSNVQ